MHFQKSIINWYNQHKRDLPWRDTQNPYYIWLSEIILQQTRVVQGKPYYEKFVENYPSVQELADAPQDEVLRLWQGLGYYSRARNLHSTAQYIAKELKGNFPTTYQELLKLKGVGTYTAAAIASFAYKEPVAVLDGNVFRVLARYFGIATDIASHEGKKEFALLSQELIPKKEPDVYNQAIMEFGALQCTPQKPNCMYCPLAETCVAYKKGWQQKLPIKTKKVKAKERYIRYFVFINKEEVVLKKRDNEDIWAGLYDFFAIEAATPQELDEQVAKNVFLKQQEKNLTLRNESTQYKHILTHRKLLVDFWQMEVADKQHFMAHLPKEYRFFDKENFENLPKPILLVKYLDKYSI